MDLSCFVLITLRDIGGHGRTRRQCNPSQTRAPPSKRTHSQAQNQKMCSIADYGTGAACAISKLMFIGWRWMRRSGLGEQVWRGERVESQLLLGAPLSVPVIASLSEQ